MRYIDNDINKGIIYDWKKIFKEYNKLVPEEYKDFETNFNKNKIVVEISERSVGKTTKWCLISMILNIEYGTVTQYLRQTREMIAPKYALEIFSAVQELEKEYSYISKITKNKYNSVIYNRNIRGWHFCARDPETTEIVEGSISEFPFFKLLSIDNNEDYKSTYNAPTGDLIIFDEFLSKYYRYNEFVYFMDLVKTIQRDRESVVIVMLANCLDSENNYLYELEIYDILATMQFGETLDYVTELGTNIQIKLLTLTKEKRKKRNFQNLLYYGFKNKNLNAITGGGWNTKDIPRLPKLNEVITLANYIYIKFNNYYLKIDIKAADDIGVFGLVYKTRSEPKEDAIILTLEEITKNNEYFGFGKLNNMIFKLLKENKIYYANTDSYNKFRSYLTNFKNYEY